jgi:hypothetical protein
VVSSLQIFPSKVLYKYPIPHACYMLTNPILFGMIIIIYGEGCQIMKLLLLIQFSPTSSLLRHMSSSTSSIYVTFYISAVFISDFSETYLSAESLREHVRSSCSCFILQELITSLRANLWHKKSAVKFIIVWITQELCFKNFNWKDCSTVSTHVTSYPVWSSKYSENPRNTVNISDLCMD